MADGFGLEDLTSGERFAAAAVLFRFLDGAGLLTAGLRDRLLRFGVPALDLKSTDKQRLESTLRGEQPTDSLADAQVTDGRAKVLVATRAVEALIAQHGAPLSEAARQPLDRLEALLPLDPEVMSSIRRRVEAEASKAATTDSPRSNHLGTAAIVGLALLGGFLGASALISILSAPSEDMFDGLLEGFSIEEVAEGFEAGLEFFFEVAVVTEYAADIFDSFFVEDAFFDSLGDLGELM